MTFKVDQGHWRWHNSISHTRIDRVLLSRRCKSCIGTIFEIFDVEEYCDQWPWNLGLSLALQIYTRSVYRWNLQTLSIVSIFSRSCTTSSRSCVTVAQGHRNYYQSKARMWHPIGLPCNCMPIFYRFQNITIYWLKILVETLRFSSFYPPQPRLKPYQGGGFPTDLGYDS